MTENKDLKRLIRARMEKTGESYTAARANLLASDPQPLPDDYQKLAGASDAAVLSATGRSWREWTAILDRARAAELDHSAIAAFVAQHDGVSGWWAQSVTVGYERFRGLRDVGQRRGGGYEVSKSKTIAVPVGALWSAVEDEATRAAWLPDTLVVRTAIEPRSMRARLSDETPLDLYFAPKGDAKSTITLQHRELPDRETADAMKAYWGERLESLNALLTGAPRG